MIWFFLFCLFTLIEIETVLRFVGCVYKSVMQAFLLIWIKIILVWLYYTETSNQKIGLLPGLNVNDWFIKIKSIFIWLIIGMQEKNLST